MRCGFAEENILLLLLYSKRENNVCGPGWSVTVVIGSKRQNWRVRCKIKMLVIAGTKKNFWGLTKQKLLEKKKKRQEDDMLYSLQNPKNMFVLGKVSEGLRSLKILQAPRRETSGSFFACWEFAAGFGLESYFLWVTCWILKLCSEINSLTFNYQLLHVQNIGSCAVLLCLFFRTCSMGK